MHVAANIEPSVIIGKPITVNYALAFHLPSNNRLQGGFSAIWNSLHLDLALACNQLKDNHLTVSAAAPFAFANNTHQRTMCRFRSGKSTDDFWSQMCAIVIRMI